MIHIFSRSALDEYYEQINHLFASIETPEATVCSLPAAAYAEEVGSLTDIADAIRIAESIFHKMNKENIVSDMGFKSLMDYAKGLRYDLQRGTKLDVEIIRKVGFKNIFSNVKRTKESDSADRKALSRFISDLKTEMSDASSFNGFRVKLILDNRLVNAANADSHSLLTQTCTTGKRMNDLCPFLLQAGADPNWRVLRDSPPPLFAALNISNDEQASDHVLRLEAYGADLNAKYHTSSTRSFPLAFRFLYTPMTKERSSLLQTLVANGMDINAQLSKPYSSAEVFGLTLLSSACAQPSRKGISAIQSLLYLGAKVTSEARRLAAAQGYTQYLARIEKIRTEATEDVIDPGEEAITKLYSRKQYGDLQQCLFRHIFSTIIHYAGVHETIITTNYAACIAMEGEKESAADCCADCCVIS